MIGQRFCKPQLATGWPRKVTREGARRVVARASQFTRLRARGRPKQTPNVAVAATRLAHPYGAIARGVHRSDMRGKVGISG